MGCVCFLLSSKFTIGRQLGSTVPRRKYKISLVSVYTTHVVLEVPEAGKAVAGNRTVAPVVIAEMCGYGTQRPIKK